MKFLTQIYAFKISLRWKIITKYSTLVFSLLIQDFTKHRTYSLTLAIYLHFSNYPCKYRLFY